MRWWSSVGLLVVVGMATVVGAQERPVERPPADYQQLLERALTREGTQHNACAQQREDLIKYFQEEIRKRDKQLEAASKQPPHAEHK